MMKISEIITRHYSELRRMVSTNKVVSQSKTEEDFLQDACLTALGKFKDKDIDEEEGMDYLRKTISHSKTFQYNKKACEIIIYTDNLLDYDEGAQE